jgi:outer membrane protein
MRMGRHVRALAGLLLLAALPAASFAADLTPLSPSAASAASPAAAPPKPEWTVELGFELRTLPHYQGSSVYGVYPFPLLDVRAAGTPPRFHAPRDGIGYALYDTEKIKAGPVVQVELGRHVKHNPSLEGLGNIGATAEVGGFVDYWPVPWLRARVELRQGFGGHHGVVSDQTVDLVVPVGSQWTLSGGPRMTVASHEANAPYFDVNLPQSAASGLPVYDSGSGIRSLGAGGQARYQWNRRWASHGFVEYSRLVGGVGSSPVVMDRGAPDQGMIGFGTTYSFDVPKLW